MRWGRGTRLALVGVTVTLVLVAWWRSANPGVARAARAALQAVLDGDAATLYRFSSKQERQWACPSEAQMAAVLRDLVQPKLRAVKTVSGIKTTVQNDLSEARAEVMLSGPGGRVFPVYVEMYSTEDGPRGSMVLTALMAAWKAEYHADRSGAPGLTENFVALRKGLEMDRQRLDSIGVHGFYHVSTVPWMPKNHRTFDDYLMHWQKMESLASGP